MDDVRPALLSAQDVVGRSGIEDEDVALGRFVGDGEQHVGRKVGDDKADALGSERAEGVQCLLLVANSGIPEFVFLLGELSRRVVVLDGELSPGEPVVLRRPLDQRDRRAGRERGSEVADDDLLRVGLLSAPRRRQPRAPNEKSSASRAANRQYASENPESASRFLKLFTPVRPGLERKKHFRTHSVERNRLEHD